MEHELYFDGNQKRIAWMLKGDPRSKQMREHADIYLDKVTVEQSKYIALHVGIFWCIGTFRIKNSDTVNVMLDSQTMYEHLIGKKEVYDKFINKRTWFINQLIDQRDLHVKYHLIDENQNIATKLLGK